VVTAAIKDIHAVPVGSVDLKAIRTVRDVVDYICIKVENGGRHELAVQS